MSNASKSGDNRLFQMMIVLITAVVGPLVVFFVTNAAKSNPAAPTQPAVVLTQPAAGPTIVVVTATEATGGQATPTPAGVSNPKGTLPAGTNALVDGLALWVDPNELQVNGQTIVLKIHVRNLGDARRTLTYTPASFVLHDDQGNAYEPYFGDKKPQCRKDDLSLQKTLQIDPGKEVVLSSPGLDNYGQWCDANAGQAIPLFKGPLVGGAGVLRVGIQGVGPFTGFTIEIKL